MRSTLHAYVHKNTRLTLPQRTPISYFIIHPHTIETTEQRQTFSLESVTDFTTRVFTSHCSDIEIRLTEEDPRACIIICRFFTVFPAQHLFFSMAYLGANKNHVVNSRY